MAAKAEKRLEEVLGIAAIAYMFLSILQEEEKPGVKRAEECEILDAMRITRIGKDASPGFGPEVTKWSRS